MKEAKQTPGDNVIDGQKLKQWLGFLFFFFFLFFNYWRRDTSAADVAKSPIFEIRVCRRYNIYIS